MTLLGLVSLLTAWILLAIVAAALYSGLRWIYTR